MCSLTQHPAPRTHDATLAVCPLQGSRAALRQQRSVAAPSVSVLCGRLGQQADQAWDPSSGSPEASQGKDQKGSLPCTNTGESKGAGPLPFPGKVTHLISETLSSPSCVGTLMPASPRPQGSANCRAGEGQGHKDYAFVVGSEVRGT